MTVVSCTFVPGQINYFGTSSPYWDCENWPEAMKTQSVEFKDLDEPTDKEEFQWICPERCMSMPYFDIKMSFSFNTWQFRETVKNEYDIWYQKIIQENYWRGNGRYREAYPQIYLTNLPSGEGVAGPIPVRYTDGSYYTDGRGRAGWKKIPDSLVTSVGECKKKANQWNFDKQQEECSIKTTHLTFEMIAPASGVGDYKVKLDVCSFQEENVNIYNSYCSQQKRSDIVSVKPSYVFFPGSTGKKENAGVCQVVHYTSAATISDAARDARTNSAWTTAPRYTKHTYEFKKVAFEYETEWYGHPLEYESTSLVINNVGETPPKSKVNYNRLKTKKYEWICRVNDRWKYFEAKQYESKCSQEICQNFITPPCWENVHSIAALPCAWGKRVKETGSTDGFVSFAQMTDSQYARGMHSYGGGSYAVTFPIQMVASTRSSSIESGATIPIAEGGELKIELKPLYSCNLCEEASRGGVWGVVTKMNKREMQLVECRECMPYEKIIDFSCEECLPFHTTRLWSLKGTCIACPVAKPMRRSGGVDSNCTECEILNYFNVQNENGCLQLRSVRLAKDGSIDGVDEVSVIQGQAREIRRKYYRHVQSNTVWSSAVKELACDSRETSVSQKTELSYRRWCGHNEMKREQQALLQIGNSSRYYLYSTNSMTTQGHAAISTVCADGSWRSTDGGVFDALCLDNSSKTVSIHAVREGNVEKCRACSGGRYTLNCWPTYHASLRNEEEEYFSNANILSSAGTCDQCARRCALDNYYMSPEKFSCMWDEGRQARMAGFVSDVNASAYFYWYKQAPCKPCKNVLLGATQAVLVKQCGNKATFRMWDKDQTRPFGSEERSIPTVQTCCSQLISPNLADNCTREEDNANVFISENCKTQGEMQDFEPVQQNYCPPGWWVDESCAQKSSSIWSPDCCKRCLDCTGNMFKTENYAECTGSTYIDTQATGCERRCLSNSYEKNGRCYRCESCALTGTGEHSP